MRHEAHSLVNNMHFRRETSNKRFFNRVGAWGLVPHATSHTTVQAVPHTAVPTLDAIRDMNPTGSDSLSSSSWHWI